MKNEIISEEIRNAAQELGKLLRSDPRYTALAEAEEKYNTDEKMTRLIAEYNVQQSALAAQYAESEKNEEMIKIIEKRISEIYDEVTKNDMYEEYLRAKDDFDELYNEVSGILQTAITGRTACTHDCSSCGGCH